MKIKQLSGGVTALIVVALGLGFLLDALNIWDFSSVLSSWWPLSIVVLGALTLINDPRYPLWPVFVIAAGSLLLLKKNNVIDINAWDIIWPTALIITGLSLIYRQTWGKPHQVDEDAVHIFAAFSGHDTVSKSKDFRGGNITVLFGGIKLDLRQASLKQDTTLSITNVFGGIELIVPEDWSIESSGFPLFAGWEDKTGKTPKAKDAPQMRIQGTCIFGGVEIKNK